jgi:hypothetical protein
MALTTLLMTLVLVEVLLVLLAMVLAAVAALVLLQPKLNSWAVLVLVLAVLLSRMTSPVLLCLCPTCSATLPSTRLVLVLVLHSQQTLPLCSGLTEML